MPRCTFELTNVHGKACFRLAARVLGGERGGGKGGERGNGNGKGKGARWNSASLRSRVILQLLVSESGSLPIVVIVSLSVRNMQEIGNPKYNLMPSINSSTQTTLLGSCYYW